MDFLFELYGFEKDKDLSNEKVSVFSINQGGFQNAYVVSDSKSEIDKTSEALLSVGYSVRTINSFSRGYIHNVLFESFFRKKNVKSRMLREYACYAEKVVKSYLAAGQEYRYISSPYILNGDMCDTPIVVDRIVKLLEKTGPEFIIVEAAAGFGKTSTAFEICQKMAEDESKPIAILAELSRDRKAKTFRHVLLEQIDKIFPTLPSSLVEEEIKNGNLIIVLDGFDELLRGKKEDEDFEQSEAMLETISKLLERNAKVILTTRKTAILDSEGFYNWTDRHENNFRISRFEIQQPRVNDWLSSSRIKILNDNSVEFGVFSSPVVLSYLSSISDEEFLDLSADPLKIQDNYFSSLLSRERQRQNLEMTVDEQHVVFTRLAANMVQHNYTKDSRTELIQYFLDNELAFLNSVKSRYPPEDKKDENDIAHILSNHALLDRNADDDRIGFINDFVLGNYVGRSIVAFGGQEWAGDELFIEVSIQAFMTRSEVEKNNLWNKISWISMVVSDQERMSFQSRLLSKVIGAYVGASINDMTFDGIDFASAGEFVDSIFCNCTFKNVIFSACKVRNCTFIGCNFFDCKVLHDENVNAETEMSRFIGGTEDDCNIVDALGFQAVEDDCQDDQDKILRFIFGKFWPAGRDSITFAHRPLSLFFSKTDDEINPEAVANAIYDLKKQGLLLDANKKSWIGINTNRLGDISTIIGR